MPSKKDFKEFYEIYRHAWRYKFSPDEESQLTDSQCDELLKHGGLMVRNTYDFDQREESDFWYVIKDSFGGMDELSSNERNEIRRSNNIFDIKLIDFEQFKEKCFPILDATFNDYHVTDRKMNRDVFDKYVKYCSKRNFDFWGVFDKGNNELVGFCAVNIFENSCEYGLIGVLPKYKHNATYPYYGIFYKMNEYYLDQKRFNFVADGARSITEHSDIQQFLIKKFKFRKAYCKLEIHYKWWFGIIVKILLPFKKIIPNKNVKAVLKMHEMRWKEK